jgi:apolipoprotein N-acyltransferase
MGALTFARWGWPRWAGWALLLGAAQGLSVAWPWGVAQADWLAVPSALAVLWPAPGQPWPLLQGLSMVAWLVGLRRQATARQALTWGWAFGTGWLAAVFWWLFISMHTYGGLAAPLAVLAVLALAGFLALYTAATSWFFWRLALSDAGLSALVFACLWTLAELVRATWFTGFPWGAVGYAHVDSLGWLAPWVGVYGMGAVATGGAAALAVMWGRSPRRAWAWVWVGAGCLAAGPAVQAWQAQHLPDTLATRSTGALPVTLLQGNIAQDEKFEPGLGVVRALDGYGTQLAGRDLPEPLPPGSLVVAPETAFPLLPQTVDTVRWDHLLQALAQGQHAALLGIPLGNAAEGYANAVWAFTPESARAARASLLTGASPGEWDRGGPHPVYRYDKHHLVPFGEFIPPLFRWFVDLMNIPLGDFNRGELGQGAFDWAGQRVAPNICYEDLFGEELARGFADPDRAPTVLVNISNLGWFGNTVALDQHLHISRLRAKELGRPMVRATNTGATVLIDHQGQVLQAAPRLQAAVLQGVVQGREGLTPYARWASRWGLWPLGLVCGLGALAVAVVTLWAGRRSAAGPRP